MAVHIGMLQILQFGLSIVLGLTRFVVQSIVHMPAINALYLGVFAYILWCVYYATTDLLQTMRNVATISDNPEDLEWKTFAFYGAVTYLGFKLLF